MDAETLLQRRLGAWASGQAMLLAARVALAGYWVALAVGTHWPRLTFVKGDAGAFQFNKVLHVTAFAGLAVLSTLARPAGRWAAWPVQAAVGCAIAAAYSVVDELTQAFADRKVGSGDIVANLIGVLAVYLVVASSCLPRRPVGPAWPVHAARAVLLLTAPTLVFLAILPIGHEVLVRLASLVVTPRADMSGPLHFVTTMGMTWLLALAAVGGRSRPGVSALVTIAVMGLAGPIIEGVQARTGRGEPSGDDIFANALGLVTAMVVWALVVAWHTLRRARRSPADRD